MRSAAAWVASAVVLLIAAGDARGQHRRGGEGTAEERDQRSPFWREVTQPRYRRARTLLRHALHRLRAFEQEQPGMGPAQQRAFLEGAIHRLELARGMAPEDPEILFLLADAKSRWLRVTPGGVEQRLDEEALELFRALRVLDPEYEPQDVAFRLGVLHTRQRRFEEAAEEYRRAIDHELLLGSSGSATAWNNLAEVTMMSGDVQSAVQHYERAVALYRRAGVGSDLALWGLAVALDRLGEHRSAVDRAREALSHTGGSMQTLRSPSVFFEPEYELHWYEAIGHEALAEMHASAEDRAAYLRLALESWRQFLEASAGESRWEDIARRNVERIRAELGH